MKFLLTFVLMVPMIAAAGEMERLPGPGIPFPEPNPRYCPEGTHRVYDEYKGRYICVADDHGNFDRPRQCPKGMHWVHGNPGFCEYTDYAYRGDMLKRMSGLKDALNGGAAVADLFDGAAARWQLIHTNPEVTVPPKDPKEKPVRVIKVAAGDGDIGWPPVNPFGPQRPPAETKPRPQDPRPAPPAEIPQLPQTVIPGTVRKASHIDGRKQDPQPMPNPWPRPETPNPGPKKPAAN